MPRGTPIKEQKTEGVAAKNPVVEENLTAGTQANVETSVKQDMKKNVEISAKNNSGLPFNMKNGLVSVCSKTRSLKSITAKTGKVIQFDKDGNATVELEDALYLKGCNGFEFK